MIALYFAWQVGLTAMACIPLILAATIIQRVCLAKRFVRPSDEVSPATLLEQALRGINSVQAFGLEDKFCKDYASALDPESEGIIKTGIVAGLV